MLMDDVMMYVIINVPIELVIKCLMCYVKKNTEWRVLWFGTKSYRRLLNNRIFAWQNTFYVWVVHETFQDFYVCCHELQSSTFGFFCDFLENFYEKRKTRKDITSDILKLVVLFLQFSEQQSHANFHSHTNVFLEWLQNRQGGCKWNFKIQKNEKPVNEQSYEKTKKNKKWKH